MATSSRSLAAKTNRSEAAAARQFAKAEAKRSTIIRATIETINAKSYALVTMAEIADKIGLRDATLYHYFPDKRALAFECHRRSLARFEDILDRTLSLDGTGLDKLRRFIRRMLNDSARNGPLLYFGDYSYLETEQWEAIDQWAGRLTAKLEALLNDGIADRSIAPCETGVVVRLLLGMLIWLGKWVPGIPDLTVDRLMDAIEALSFRGLQSAR